MSSSLTIGTAFMSYHASFMVPYEDGVVLATDYLCETTGIVLLRR